MITPTMKVGIVTRRYPETVDVFEWHDIDTNDRRHATLDEISNELELEIETLLDEISQALLDYPDDADEDLDPDEEVDDGKDDDDGKDADAEVEKLVVEADAAGEAEVDVTNLDEDSPAAGDANAAAAFEDAG
jgi:hypothetical protein